MSSKPQPFVARRAPAPHSFAGYTLDTVRGSLLRGDVEIKLRPKSYEALKYLVENAGRLISKSELTEALWPETAAVSDDSLAHCIMDVRRVLGDDAQQLIRTVPARGYMFAAAVEADRKPGPLVPATKPDLRVWISSALILLLIGGVAWLVKKRADGNRAITLVPRVEELTAQRKYREAYQLGMQILAELPGEPRVTRLLNEFSDDLSVSTTPPDAEVHLRRRDSARAEWLGRTPIQRVRIVRDEYIISIQKPGYAPFERTLSSALERTRPVNKTPWDLRLQHELREASKIPPRMAAVPGGEYQLRGYSRPTEASARLHDYFIDKFEVSNQEFKAFADAGGYGNPRFWASPALAGTLKDKTGLPGPRSWVGGAFPEGKESHPVTTVTWHEAAAYCRSVGKELPTALQWEKAARAVMWTPFGVIVPWGLLDPREAAKRANIGATGTAPVESFEFGMSPFGVYNMAGNVAEWMRNPYDDGFAIAGGAWYGNIYQFGSYGPRPALHSAETLGFRCALTSDPAAGDQGNLGFVSDGEVLHYPISTEAKFRDSKARYSYENFPLNAKVAAVKDDIAWRREEIVFSGRGGESVKAFLYLPKNAAAPYQVIHYLSGATWWLGFPITDVVEGRAPRLLPYIRAGRAVILVVLKGFEGREPVGAYATLDIGSAEYAEVVLDHIIDMQRGVDYLLTRSDIDPRKIGFWNDSSFELGSIVAAIVGERYSSVILIGGGVYPRLRHIPPSVNPLHFAPHIRAPKLLLNGLYDDGTPERTSAEPFFRLLGEPKRRTRFEGGHMPPPEIGVPLINGFLDETLGPVRKQ
jgi:eukaryotic-like serine/threonine-protein kinase